MKKFLLYGHGGSYNHGAEAIARTTIEIVRQKYGKDAHVALSSHFPEQDKVYLFGVDEYFSPDIRAWEEEKQALLPSEKAELAHRMYAQALDFITRDTVCLSIGGDNFCYPNWHRLAVFQKKATASKAMSILWGCSVEPTVITQEMFQVLSSYDHILARESLTYNALAVQNIPSDLNLIPDTAFALQPAPISLPPGFITKRTVGINLSPLVLRREALPAIIKENIVRLIDYIISQTDYSIALIPHVIMPMDNDQHALDKIMETLPVSSRSRVLQINGAHSASELKYIISQCAFLVCARTHASIAAYSTGVPTLVIGYSIKSVGIATDLGVAEYVIDVSKLVSPDSILDIFKRLMFRSAEINEKLVKKQNHCLTQITDLVGGIGRFL